MTRSAVRLLAVVAVLVLATVGLAVPSVARTVPTQYVVEKPVCRDASADGHVRCFAHKLVRAKSTTPGAVARPARTAHALAYGPAGGYAPEALTTAYGVNPDGDTKITVGIVDAYDNPNALDDLNAFNAQYGLPAETDQSFRKVSQTGSTSTLPPAATGKNEGWAGEIALDVQAVRGMCHACRILLVEANSTAFSDITTAVDTAVGQGATVVSNSYGGAETFGVGGLGAYNRPGVVMLASTGDDGMYDWDYLNDASSTSSESPNAPASLNTVVAVGGTSLYLDSDGNRTDETVWNSNGAGNDDGYDAGAPLGATGGGCSVSFAAPRWQTGVPGWNQTGCGNFRLPADVSAVADPATGFDVLNTWHPSDPNIADWGTYGGTSLSSPLIAGMWALAGGSQGVPYPARTLYGHLSDQGARYDVTSGGNGLCGGEPVATCADEYTDLPNTLEDGNGVKYGTLDCAWRPRSAERSAGTRACTAAGGYDGPSGVGTPKNASIFSVVGPTARFVLGRARTAANTAFSAAGSSDPYPGAALTYAWTWGDGTTGTTATPVHRYARVGTYAVGLTIRDAYGYQAATSRRVVVTATSKTTQQLKPSTVKGKKRATLTIRVTAAGATPTGNVAIYDGKRLIVRKALPARARGRLTVKLPKVKTGKHSIRSVYSGSPYVTGGRSSTSKLTVKR